ncbi:hypothetical protein QJQ45_021552 [Haematococcus lacustris]|nr:hypothetical protein QJQ45_021552 [Haematococcus lacustris]
MAKKKRRTVPRPVPEFPDSDIEDRDEALQPDLTEAERNRKVSGEARAARDRDNTYHGRKWLRPVYSDAKRSQVRGLMSSTSYNIRFYDRDVSAALNIRRCAVGPGPRPTELCYWDGRPAMPKPGRPGQEWVYLRDKALLPMHSHEASNTSRRAEPHLSEVFDQLRAGHDLRLHYMAETTLAAHGPSSDPVLKQDIVQSTMWQAWGSIWEAIWPAPSTHSASSQNPSCAGGDEASHIASLHVAAVTAVALMR